MPSKSRRKKKQQTRLSDTKRHGNSKRAVAILRKADETKTGFSDLPPELRNTIYEYALCPSGGNAIPFRLLPELERYGDIAFNMLNTCKGIQQEATGIFYGRNRFRIDLLRYRSVLVPLEMQNRLAAAPLHTKGLVFHEIVRFQVIRGLSQLSRAISAISAKKLSLIKSFIYAYHFAGQNEAQALETFDFTRTPEFEVEVKFHKKSPYFTVEQQITAHGKQIRDGNVDGPKHYLTSMIQSRNLRTLAKKDVLDFADYISFDSSRVLKSHGISPQ